MLNIKKLKIKVAIKQTIFGKMIFRLMPLLVLFKLLSVEKARKAMQKTFIWRVDNGKWKRLFA